MSGSSHPRAGRLTSTPAVIGLLSLALHGFILTPLALDLFGSTEERATVHYPAPIHVEILPLALRGPDKKPIRNVASYPSETADRSLRDDGPGRLPPDDTGHPVAANAGVPVRSPLGSDTPRRVQPPDLGRSIADALRGGAAGCRMMAGRLDATEQRQCDQRFGDAATRAAPVRGTGDQDRDARFAAAGAQALADYERRRAPLKPNSRAQPCPHGTDIMGDCPVRVMVPLWSSTDGFLPGLKRDE